MIKKNEWHSHRKNCNWRLDFTNIDISTRRWFLQSSLGLAHIVEVRVHKQRNGKEWRIFTFNRSIIEYYHVFFRSYWQSFPLSFFLPIIRAAEVENNCINGMTWKVQWHYFIYALSNIFACNKINTQQHVVFAVVIDNIFLFSSSLLSIEQ